MRKNYIRTVLVAMLLTLFTSFSVVASNSRIARFDNKGSKILASANHEWKSAPAFVKPGKNNMLSRSVALKPAESYNLIEGPDGTQWYSTQSYETVNYYFTGSEVTIYNSKGDIQNTLKVEVPAEGSCNEIVVGDVITNNFFDFNKNTYEVPIIMHIIHSPGVTSFVTKIYDLATGELKFTYDGYMSFMKVNTGYSNEYRAVLSYKSEEKGETFQNYDIYAKATYSSNGAALKNQFSVSSKLAEYQVGSVLNIFTIGSNFYYVLSKYEKEYMDPASYEEPWEMIPTADNNFIATIYNNNFVEVGTVTIPVTSTSQYLVQYGIGLFGTEDLSNGFWDETGELRLVVATAGLEIATESESISFDVYDLKGNVVKNIATDVSDWMRMYDIQEQSKQMAFLSADEQTLSMVDIPSCETVITFGAEVDGEIISSSIDRYQKNNSYQYVVALAAPESDDNDDIFQRFAWITKEGKIDRIVKFNVGQYNASWVPLVMGEVMNPYLFDTDSQREYVFILNQRKSDSATAMVDELRIVKEDGTIVAQYQEEPKGKGDLGSCDILGLNSDTPTLLIPYRSSETEKITIELESLPLISFSAGGDGTKSNPYKITSAGDMAMIARNPSAHYVVVNDFDAMDFGAWEALPYFNGSLDGGNYKISNLVLNGNGVNSAFFANTEATIIKNIVLESPKVNLGEDVSSIGFLIAESVGDTITNVHVNKAVVTGSNTYAVVGGIIGNAMLNTQIAGCSANEIDINTPMAGSVGGIAGNTLTGSNINACAVSGSIVADNRIGGIVGSAYADCKVVNCHADVEIEGDNTIGGVVGAAERGGIHNCYVEGNITATLGKVGGIAGSLASDWTTTEESVVDAVVSKNVVALESIAAGGSASHRIVGYTRWDEDKEAAQWDPSLVPVKEVALADNYVVSILSVMYSEIAAEATSTEGADIAAEDLNKTFFETLGFKYGTDVDNPWNEKSANDPCLYFEQVNSGSGVDAIEKNQVEISYDGNVITTVGAKKIEIYNISGLKVVETAEEVIETANLTSGIYVVVVTDENGIRKSVKLGVK